MKKLDKSNNHAGALLVGCILLVMGCFLTFWFFKPAMDATRDAEDFCRHLGYEEFTDFELVEGPYRWFDEDDYATITCDNETQHGWKCHLIPCDEGVFGCRSRGDSYCISETKSANGLNFVWSAEDEQ